MLGGAGLPGLIVATAGASYAFMILPMAAPGFGMAMTMPATTPAVIEAAPADRGGIASGVVNAAEPGRRARPGRSVIPASRGAF